MYRCRSIPRAVLRNVVALSWRPSRSQETLATIIPFNSSLRFLISRTYHSDPQIAELRKTVSTKELTKDLVVDLISNPRFVNGNDMEFLVQLCMKHHLPTLALNLFTSLDTLRLLPKLTYPTVSNLLRMCTLKRENKLIDRIYDSTPDELRMTLAFQAEYARALLAGGDYYTGIQIVRQFVQSGLHSSDCNNILLEGLSEGNYNEECLRLYVRIRQAMKRTAAGEQIQLYSHGYSAVVRSACRLKKVRLAESVMTEMQQRNIIPLEFAYFEMCEMYEHRTDWRRTLEQTEQRLKSKQIQLTDKEKHILIASLKEKQYRKAVNVMEEYERYYDNKQVIDDKNQRILLRLSNLPVSPARMMTLMAFYHYESQIYNPSLIIEAGTNVESISKFLRMDLFPLISFSQNKGTMQIPGEGIRTWLHHNKQMSL